MNFQKSAGYILLVTGLCLSQWNEISGFPSDRAYSQTLSSSNRIRRNPQFQGQPGTQFGPSGNTLGTILQETQSSQFGQQNGQFGQPSGQFGQFGQPSGQFGQPNGQFSQPNGQFGQPSGQFGQPNGQFGQPDQTDIFSGQTNGQSSGQTNGQSSGQTNGQAPNSDAATQSCIQNCQATSQYNPVCGSDNMTYDNESRLRCAQQCNRRVTIEFFGRCPTTPAPTPSRN